MKRFLNILFFLSIVSSIAAQAPYIESALDTNSILIGEQTNITFSVYYNNESDQVKFPEFSDTLIKNVEIIELSSIDTLKEKNLFKQQLKVKLTSFDSGYYAIQPMKFQINTTSLESEALLLEVRNVDLDSLNLAEVQMSDFNDIKDIYQDPFSFSEFIKVYASKIIIGISSLGALTFLAWFMFLKNAPEPQEKKESIVVIPDFELALNRLQSIKDKEIWQNGNNKRYHTEVTETVRTYLETRFNINAMEQTSEEIIQQMRFSDISVDAQNHLVRMLKLGDMVKFAKEEPQAKENIATMDLAVDFINKTKRTFESDQKA